MVKTEVILNECEASLVVKSFENYKIVSLRKTSIHDNKEGGLLSRHNSNMTKSLSDTQNTYLAFAIRIKRDASWIKWNNNWFYKAIEFCYQIVLDI